MTKNAIESKSKMWNLWHGCKAEINFNAIK